jgi:hypothetical protein
MALRLHLIAIFNELLNLSYTHLPQQLKDLQELPSLTPKTIEKTMICNIMSVSAIHGDKYKSGVSKKFQSDK